MQLPKKQKTISQFFAPFLRSKPNLEHFEKYMTLKAYVFSKFRFAKYAVRKMSKKNRSRALFDREHKGPKHC